MYMVFSVNHDYMFLIKLIFLEEDQFFEKYECYLNPKGVKGSLKKHLHFWQSIGASEFVLKTISEGYVIPFIEPPKSMIFKNNKSAFSNAEFVDKAVSELVENGCAIKVPFRPHVVNPLSVATNKANKKRLILDLSVLSRSVKKDKFKYEDWKVAVQLFSSGCFMYKFDLKSGYYHFDICHQQQTFLGFSWKGSFYFTFHFHNVS